MLDKKHLEKHEMWSPHSHSKKGGGAKKKPPNPPHIFLIQMKGQVLSPAHKKRKVLSEDSNNLLPLIAYMRTTSHVTPRPRKADVTWTWGQSQADE